MTQGSNKRFFYIMISFAHLTKMKNKKQCIIAVASLKKELSQEERRLTV